MAVTNEKVLREPVRENDGPLVFICQNQHKWDEEARAFVPKFDFEEAAKFGTLVEVLSPTASPFNFTTLLPDLHRKLSHFRDGDYILLIGNPAIIGAVTALAASYNEGRVTVLQWSGRDIRYIPIEIEDLEAWPEE